MGSDGVAGWKFIRKEWENVSIHMTYRVIMETEYSFGKVKDNLPVIVSHCYHYSIANNKDAQVVDVCRVKQEGDIRPFNDRERHKVSALSLQLKEFRVDQIGEDKLVWSCD